jgi:hypothetical protein
MNKTRTTDRNFHLNIDNAANAVVIAAGLVAVVYAAATADIDPIARPAQVARQERDAGTATQRDVVRVADSSPRRFLIVSRPGLEGDSDVE